MLVETNKFSTHLEHSKEQHKTMKIIFTELYIHSLIRRIKIQLFNFVYHVCHFYSLCCKRKGFIEWEILYRFPTDFFFFVPDKKKRFLLLQAIA